jgi:GDPmannose 4,6-dehydratase
MKVALITGITGQDGSYLAELLLSKNYIVHGIIRRSSSFNTMRIDHIYQDRHSGHNGHNGTQRLQPQLQLHYGDLSDASALRKIIEEVQPDEIYNLGAQSHVKVSFIEPEYTSDITGLGVIRLLEIIRDIQPRRPDRLIKLYQAGSSEMYGSTPPPQSETTRFHPRSPYAASKVFAHNVCVNYREAYVKHSFNFLSNFFF